MEVPRIMSTTQDNQSFLLVGNKNINRRDITAKITGQRPYTVDIRPSDVGATSFVYMGYLVSPYPYATIKSIDVSQAESLGYVTITATDLPPYDLFNYGRSHMPIASGVARFAGQPVVALGADSPKHVADGLALINVEFEPLPYVFDAEVAAQPNAPQVWPGGNVPTSGVGEGGEPIPSTTHIAVGDAPTAYSQAAVTVETTLDFGILQHLDMEPRGLIANWNGGNIEVWGNTQWAHNMQRILSSYFQVPLANVTVRTALGGYEGGGTMGTGLGNKTEGEEYLIAVAMSRKAGSPVKFMHTKLTNTLATTNRFPARGYVKLGATSDGKLSSMIFNVYFNSGANGGAVGSDTVTDLYDLYVTPNLLIDATPVNTNAFSLSSAMRNVGGSQGHWITEIAIDMLAEKLNIDPAQFRLMNMHDVNSAVDPTNGFKYSGFGNPSIYQNVLSTFDWSSKWQGWGNPSSISGTTRNGVGTSITNSIKGAISPPDTGQIQVDPDGTVTMFSGITDHGAGGNTVLPIIAAELLGLTPEQFDNIKVVQSDTSLTTDSGVTAGSRGTRNGGMGLVQATADLKKQWFPTVAKKLGVSDWTALGFGNGTIYDTTNPSNSIAFKDAAALLTSSIKGYGTYNGPSKTVYRVAGGRCAEVQVDIETGDVRVVSFAAGISPGRVLFWKGAVAQELGGFIGMGIGEAFYEQLINDPSTGFERSGSYLNPNLLDYKMPSILQTPDTSVPLFYNYVDPIGPFGGTGMGEPVLESVSVVLANALSNALGGYRFLKLPIRREDVINAIQTQQTAGKI